jgi:hypothetical protein
MMRVPDETRSKIQRDGFEFLPARTVEAWLGADALADWPAFAASWDDLGEDRFMADGGRYRRRRHAALSMEAGVFTRKPHQPHYQSRDYNVVTRAVFGVCADLIGGLAAPRPWHVEMHQFRIEAAAARAASPTPEGLHRDGVDWVFVMLVRRENVAEGVTRIAGAGGAELDRFVLADPMDAVFLDDRRVRHGVTAITPIDPDRPAYRDALVVTFAATPPEG